MASLVDFGMISTFPAQPIIGTPEILEFDGDSTNLQPRKLDFHELQASEGPDLMKSKPPQTGLHEI